MLPCLSCAARQQLLVENAHLRPTNRDLIQANTVNAAELLIR
jgi:hypothetical protein